LKRPAGRTVETAGGRSRARAPDCAPAFTGHEACPYRSPGQERSYSLRGGLTPETAR